jgi:hypothetical protein
VSPDATTAAVVPHLVDRAVLRARVLAAAESAAVGASVAAWSVPSGLVVALAFALWRSRFASKRAVVEALERANPGSQNLFVTADEIDRGLVTARPAVRARVKADAARAADSTRPAAALPARRLGALVVVAVAAWATVAAGIARRTRPIDVPLTGDAASAGVNVTPPGVLHVSVTIEPPSYTGLASTTATDPLELQAIENSHLIFLIRSGGHRVIVEANDTKRTLEPVRPGVFEYRDAITRSGFVLLTADDGGRRMMPIAMMPDTPPAVRLVVPGRDLVFAGGNATIRFDARATDDYGLGSLALRYTKVSGSGEQFEFVEGDVPLSIAKTSAREWEGSAARSLTELGLADGDMLVYRAVAAEGRPGGRESSSDAFFIEISKVGAAAGDAFTLPQEETRYALSQQMLIVKTERLNQRRASMPAPDLTEASQGLAIEQRMIRSEFVFMLGGEVEDEEVEAAQSTELQEGRLANRGQSDLRAATVAMSQAEKLLTAGDTVEALKVERAAVAALQRAFARDRYILRALATRAQLDLTRRLTGVISPGKMTVGWRRLLADVPANRRAAQLESLLQGLGEVESAGWRSQIAVLAEMAIRIDPQSQALRRAATDLQRLEDTWPGMNANDRLSALSAIADVVSGEAGRSLADPPASVGGTR